MERFGEATSQYTLTRPDRSRETQGRSCSETSWSGHARAIMTPSPCWQAPRSVDWTPRPDSSSRTHTARRTPSRRRSSAAGGTCPDCATSIASTPGCTGSSSTPAVMRSGPRSGAASKSSFQRSSALCVGHPGGVGRPGPDRAWRAPPRARTASHSRPPLLPAPTDAGCRGSHGDPAGDREVAPPSCHPGASRGA